jgi:hypothetical protein
MLKARYNAGSFEPYTARLIEKLTEMTDEISSYYRLKTSDRTSPSNNENVPK